MFGRLGRAFGGLGLDTGTDGVVNGLWLTVPSIQLLFVVGVNKIVFTVLADENFIRHERYYNFK